MKGKPLNVDCPICGKSLNIDTYVPGQASKEPVDVKEDDITFCFNCRTVLVMSKDLQQLIPDEDELYEIIHDDGFHDFIYQIDFARKNKPNMN